MESSWFDQRAISSAISHSKTAKFKSAWFSTAVSWGLNRNFEETDLYIFSNTITVHITLGELSYLLTTTCWMECVYGLKNLNKNYIY